MTLLRVRPTTSSSLPRYLARVAALAGCVFAVTVCGESSKFPTSTKSSGGNPPSGDWVFPPQDTTVLSGDSFLVKFHAADGAGLGSISFTGYTVSGDSALGTFATTQVYTAIGASFPTPGPKDTSITRTFKALANNITDSVFLAATVTNINKATKTIVQRIRVAGDTVAPRDTIQLPAKAPLLTVAAGDSVFVRTHVMDNKGVVSLVLSGQSRRGNPALGTDTVVTRYTSRTVALPQSRDTVVTRYLRAVVPVDSTGEIVYIVAAAKDSAGNTKVDTTQVRVVSGPKVTIITPDSNAVTSPNKQLTISVHASGGQGVKILGYRAAGVFNDSNSVIATPVNGKLLDTLTYTRTVTIPGGTVPGTFAITAFAVDSTGNPSAAITPVVVTVQPIGVADNTPPLVQFTVPIRVEAGDSINVTATDPSGIAKVGFIARDSAGTILVGDSVNFAGAGTFVSYKFRLKLDTITTFPRVVRVEAFAVDNATTPNRGVSSFSGTPKAAPADQDTLTLVAGSTFQLPQGGKFGDAIVDPNNQRMYLSNTLLDQLEVFNLATNTFGAPIRVGSQPVGLALWPRDTLGDNRDTVIVANSGGTNFSIVDLVNGQEIGRHILPNYVVQTVKTQPTAAGGIEILTTNYDLADRPQYVGAVCRHLTGATCDSVIAVYSTAPTPAQPGPFTNRGYLAWENLSNTASRSGHFLWELAQAGTDTIQIISVRDTLPGQPIRDTILGAGVGALLNLGTMAFQESTFVRNSGDFNHTVVGEGGFNQGFARALTLDGRQSVVTSINPPCPLRSPAGVTLAFLNCNVVFDNGTSPGVLVSDFVINRAANVLAVGTNFNGRTNVVRADSIYVFNYALKQVGLLQTVGSTPGMDVDPANKFDPMQPAGGAPGYNNDRLVLAARSDAAIDVFDTYWYQRVATIPIRDTIVGPVRIAKVGGVLVLAGVTTRGVVVVRLPNFANPFPGAPVRPPAVNTKPVVQTTASKRAAQQ